MSLTIFRILFFCLVPLGIFILVKTIRMLKGIFFGKILAEIPFTQKEVKFEVTTPGVYAVWQKGQLFRRTLVDKYILELVKDPSGEQVSLPRSFFNPHVNGFDSGRMEMNRFSAQAGYYRLILKEKSGASIFEGLFYRLFPARPVDYTQYFIEVRESRPVYYMIAAIPLFALTGFCIIGGFVAGFMAPSILTDMGIAFY
jgi:hypothetical protein